MRRRSVPQGGYVLVMVLALLAVASFVALRLAERTDALRRGAGGVEAYAQAQGQALGALAVTRYWMATRGLHPAGHVEGTALLREDGRWHQLPDGAAVAVQDHRGLLPINWRDLPAITQLLIELGLDPATAQAWRDVLDDYIDPDSLRRLNGAEREDYERLGLPPPRNDWLLSLRELEQLPRWRDRPDLVRRLQRQLHLQIHHQFNPVVATPEVMRARYPGVAPEAWARIEGLRRGDQLFDARQAQGLLGLPMDEDDTLLMPGFTSRITVWAPGLPQALDYNLRLTPAGQDGPWIVLDQHAAPRPVEELRRAPRFPLALSDAERSPRPRPAAP